MTKKAALELEYEAELETTCSLTSVLALHRDLRIEAMTRDGNRWLVHLMGAQFREREDGKILGVVSVIGASLKDAIDQVCQLISGTDMIIDSFDTGKGRRVIRLPATVVAEGESMSAPFSLNRTDQVLNS